MGQRDAQILESLRSDILTRLIEVRTSIDHGYAEVDPEQAAEQFRVVLDKMQLYLASQDMSTYRSFARRFMAMRVGEGFAYENLIHAIVAIGDVVAQMARAKLPETPEREEFIRAVMRMSFVQTRVFVSLLAEDLAERMQQRNRILQGES